MQAHALALGRQEDAAPSLFAPADEKYAVLKDRRASAAVRAMTYSHLEQPDQI